MPMGILRLTRRAVCLLAYRAYPDWLLGVLDGQQGAGRRLGS
jgi:hypothetical protein